MNASITESYLNSNGFYLELHQSENYWIKREPGTLCTVSVKFIDGKYKSTSIVSKRDKSSVTIHVGSELTIEKLNQIKNAIS